MKHVIVWNALTGTRNQMVVHEKFLHKYVQIALIDLKVPIKHRTVFNGTVKIDGKSYEQTNLMVGNLKVASILVG